MKANRLEIVQQENAERRVLNPSQEALYEQLALRRIRRLLWQEWWRSWSSVLAPSEEARNERMLREQKRWERLIEKQQRLY